jgi:hypothetical protein
MIKNINLNIGSRKNSSVTAADLVNGAEKKSKNTVSPIIQNPGDFSLFPEISKKTIENLIKNGILSLFPV